MKRGLLKFLRFLFVLMLPLGLSGCFVALLGGAAAGSLVALDRRTVGIQTEDESIEWKVRDAIAKQYGDKVHVNQTSYNRKVLLSGEVPTETVRADIERIAAAQLNVERVWNELSVGPLTSFSARSSDSFITSKVKTRFVDSSRLRANLVKVVTEARTVFLMGIVTRAEADAAIEIARTTSDVKKVVTLLEIVSVEQAKKLDIISSGDKASNTTPRQE